MSSRIKNMTKKITKLNVKREMSFSDEMSRVTLWRNYLRFVPEKEVRKYFLSRFFYYSTFRTTHRSRYEVNFWHFLYGKKKKDAELEIFSFLLDASKEGKLKPV